MGTSSIDKILVADNLVKSPANKRYNYWSPLSCLVEEQENEEVVQTIADHLLLIAMDNPKTTVKNKIAETWKRKLANRSGILDTGCTSGAGTEKDTDCFLDTGLPSKKGFHAARQNIHHSNQKDETQAQTERGGG
jgi:hypothetical protein